jgi:hypothetical protein
MFLQFLIEEKIEKVNFYEIIADILAIFVFWIPMSAILISNNVMLGYDPILMIIYTVMMVFLMICRSFFSLIKSGCVLKINDDSVSIQEGEGRVIPEISEENK